MPRAKKQNVVHLDLDTLSQKQPRPAEKTDGGKSIGAALKSARDKKKMSVADVSDKLNIKQKYIEALENGHYYVFPAIVYGFGFLRSYAHFLGLDAEEMIQKFHDETETIESPEIDMLTPEETRSLPSGKIIILALAALVAAYIAWYMLALYQIVPGIPLHPAARAVVEQPAEPQDDGAAVLQDQNPVTADEVVVGRTTGH
ncbi:MAG: helix-turn-helix domain-containing protein [Alphaproteobacteria bacterium]|nr:helix-turn-helix domain-containing protein [Alphaproteobacteria bacterium]